MSEPAPTTGRGDARIVARGFARYDGPRSGVPGAIRSVAWQSIRATLGIGRLARHKIFPIISVAIAYVPAIVFVGIWFMTEPVTRKPGVRLSVQKLSVPQSTLCVSFLNSASI